MKGVRTRIILRELWKQIRVYRFVFFFIFFTIIFLEGVNVLIPLYYKKFFDLLTSPQVGSKDELVQSLVSIITIVLMIHGLCWLIWRIMALTRNWLQTRLMADLSQSAHASILEHSYSFFSDNFAGSLVRKVSRLGRSSEELLDQLQFRYIPLVVVIVGNLYVLYTRHYMLAVILLVWVVVFIVSNVWYSMWKYRYDVKQVELDSEATGILSDSVSNAVTVKLFTGIPFEKDLYQNVTERLRKMQLFRWNLGELSDGIQAGLMAIIEFLLIYFAIQYWQQGLLTIGDFALIQGYLIAVFGKLWDLGRSIRRTYEALADAGEMVEIMQQTPGVIDAKKAKALVVTEGRIEFQNVQFNFHETRRILNGLNLLIEPGEKVALVGPSGAGKSTITKLLLRFYDLTKGKILIDGQQISKVTQESLRANIAMVPQEPVLFHRTIMENIRYGRMDATDEEIYEAAKKARCHTFITELQNGYDTYVGERGVKLSGGERQRVAIARALLKNAPILILDEATSSLDSESESLIQEALKELMKGKTTIVIAHRLSTIMHMDRIIVIENGQVVDTGTHKELLKRRAGTYKKLWHIQTSEYAN